MIRAVVAVGLTLSLAIFISGTSLSFPSSSSHVTKRIKKGEEEEPHILPMANTDHRNFFFIERKQAIAFLLNFLLGPLAHFSWVWIGYSGNMGSCLTASFSLMLAPILPLTLPFWISHLAFMTPSPHFLTNDIGVVAALPSLWGRQKFEEELGSAIQAQVICKYLIPSSWGKCQESVEFNINLFVPKALEVCLIPQSKHWGPRTSLILSSFPSSTMPKYFLSNSKLTVHSNSSAKGNFSKLGSSPAP